MLGREPDQVTMGLDLQELEAEVQRLRSSHRWDAVIMVVRQIIRWTGIVIVVYLVCDTLVKLAGTETIVNMEVNFLGLDLSKLIATGGISVALAGAGYGLTQRKLRRDKIPYLAGRIMQDETKRDPGRTSSGLNERGETPEEDRV